MTRFRLAMIWFRLKHIIFNTCTRLPLVRLFGEPPRPITLGTVCPVCWRQYP